MKTKLTITVDHEVVPRAKRYARSQGTSLSHLIERALREVSMPAAETFASRWRGRFRPARRSKDERYRRLAKKYL
ncbi:MAG: DUF6364 family protein [Burkholderiales bacterium]